MRLFKCYVNLGWRIHNFRLATFHHFGSLRKGFLPCREIFHFRTSCQALVGILATWKCDSSTAMRASNKRYLAFLRYSQSFWWPENTFPQVSWDPRFKDTWLPVGAYSTFWWTENAILGWSWNHQLKCTWLFVKAIYCVLATWKCDFARVMSSNRQAIVQHGLWKCS
jgi:hypothetical protein